MLPNLIPVFSTAPAGVAFPCVHCLVVFQHPLFVRVVALRFSGPLSAAPRPANLQKDLGPMTEIFHQNIDPRERGA